MHFSLRLSLSLCLCLCKLYIKAAKVNGGVVLMVFFGEKEKWGLENDGFRVENLGVIL